MTKQLFFFCSVVGYLFVLENAGDTRNIKDTSTKKINYQHVTESKYNTMPRVFLFVVFYFHSQLHIIFVRMLLEKPFVEKQ